MKYEYQLWIICSLIDKPALVIEYVETVLSVGEYEYILLENWNVDGDGASKLTL